MQMKERSGWWIFKSWGSGTADYLGISSGHVKLSSQGNVVLDSYGISDSCNNCSEAYGYAGSVSFTFGGTIDQIQGVFNVSYGGQSSQMLLP